VNITLWLAAMWVSEVWYMMGERHRYHSAHVAYCRLRGTVLFDRVMTGRIQLQEPYPVINRITL
jgi:hypothetical protein